MLIATLLIGSCTAKRSTVPPDLAGFVPTGTKSSETFDRRTGTSRTAMVKMPVNGSVEDYVASFKSKARADGYEEQVDQRSGTGRVIAYRASGDRTLTLQITTDPAGTTAAVVISSP